MLLFWLLLLPLEALGKESNPSSYLTSHSDNETQSLLWGPYRPNLYFGLRPRLPQSLMTGLMWFGTQDYQSISQTRHACDQGDGLDSYTWTEYDARQGGVQVLKDSKNNIEITTEFLKVPGGNNGGSWAARIKGKPMNPLSPSHTSFIFYSGLEGLGGLDMDTDESENGLDGQVHFSGSSPDLDEFTIRVVDGLDNIAVETGPHAHVFADRIGKTHYLGLRVPPGDMWQAKEAILQNIIKQAQETLQSYRDPTIGPPDPSFVLQLTDDVYTGSNLYAIQKSFDGEFSFDVFYESGSSKQKLSSATLDAGIPALVESYDKRFQSTFPIPPSYNPPKTKSLESFSKEITANLMGGIGYFFGTSIVDKGFAQEWDQEDEFDFGANKGGENDDEVEERGARLAEPRSLLTATPSRSFFPRGFYWDEGFHLMHIGQFDNDLSLEILKDWINLIDDDGWVAREQILGEEARSKVPPEFQTQVPNFANPPTLTMAVTDFIARLKARNFGPNDSDLGMGGPQTPFSDDSTTTSGSLYMESPELALDYLKAIYGPLKRHYDWFRRTQRGQIKQYSRKSRSRTEAYRWRGRSQMHVLTSGMDDYPRGPPHAGELHLDLISWMGFFTKTMREISGFIGETEDEASFGEIEKAIVDNLDDLHWSDEDQMYCDASVNDDDESYHVCHKGYLSLFPLMLSLLPPDSSHVGAILEMLHDPKELWSPYGIRSLSVSHPEFGQGEDYWKGPIWMQMNYMVLGSLYKTYGAQEGPYQQKAKQVYAELRKNVIDNTFKEYERTGYVWEQYDALTGEGRRSHPFTGWTSLVSLILAEKY